MAGSIYIATSEAHSGKSLITLGLIELSLRKTSKVGIFRPIIHQRGTAGQRDDHLDLILSHFNLNLDFKDCYAFTREEAADLVGHGKIDELIERVISVYKNVEDQCDFVLIEGTDFLGESAAFEFDLNAIIAKNLRSPVLIVESGIDAAAHETLRNVNLAVDSFLAKECHVMGVVINRMTTKDVDKVHKLLRKELPKDVLLYLIPENKVLSSPTLQEVVKHLHAEVLYGEDKLGGLAHGFIVAAMQIQHFLDYLKDRYVIITPGDRADIIMATLQAHYSVHYPSVAGIILTGGFRPASSVVRILDGLPEIIPILSVPENTFQTALCISNIQTKLTAENNNKIALSLKLFEDYIDTEEIEEKILGFQPQGMTPKMFNYILTRKAIDDRQHIVLPEGEDERILRAAENLLAREIVKITLLGDEAEIRNRISRLGLKFPKKDFQIITPQAHPHFMSFVKELYKLRKHKGITLEMAYDLMSDVSYLGTMIVYKGEAAGMVSGAVHTTQQTIRPALQFIKTKPGYSVVSSVFFMCLEDRVLVYGDCAVNPNPNAAQLAEIAISSAETAVAFGIEPRVALLSYSSGASSKGEEVEKVRKATQIVKEKKPDLLVEGPIQYDAAVDPDVAKQKMPDSRVAGKATVLIFPDLNTGNNTYKAVQRETGAIAIGPVLQGLNKPVNDLSRGCTVEDIVNTVIITAIQSQANS